MGNKLTRAAKEGDLEEVKRCLEKGANIDSRDWSYRTALIWAAERGEMELVKLLLDKGANTFNPVVLNGEQIDAYWRALKYSHHEIANLIHQERVAVHRFHQGKVLTDAAKQGSVGQVKKYLDGGTNVDSKDKNGCTALHKAASSGSIKVVRLLLEKDATFDIVDKEGKTAFDVAKEGPVKELLRGVSFKAK